MSTLRSFPSVPATRRGPRRARLARLQDGTTVLLRLQTQDDHVHVARLYTRLSASSRHLRFFRAMPADPPAVVLETLGAVDGASHVAVLAFHRGQAVGAARYVRDRARPEEAELAFAVADDFHGRGVGRALLEALRVHAAEAGVERLTFDTLGENVAAQKLLRSLGAQLHAGGGLVSGVLPVVVPRGDARLLAA